MNYSADLLYSEYDDYDDYEYDYSKEGVRKMKKWDQHETREDYHTKKRTNKHNNNRRELAYY